MFSCEFCEISKNNFFKEHLRTTASKNRDSNNFRINIFLPSFFLSFFYLVLLVMNFLRIEIVKLMLFIIFTFLSCKNIKVTLNLDYFYWKYTLSLREKCPYSELFWSSFSHIWAEYGEILRIFPYSVRMRENTDLNSSEYGHILRSV